MRARLLQGLRGSRPRAREAAWMAAVVLLATLYTLTPWGRSLDRQAFDSLFLLRGALPAPEDIVVVAIDEASFADAGVQWPWPRSLHARLLDALFAAGARVVALDIIFSEPSAEDEDAALAAAVARHPGTVLATDFSLIDRERYVQEIRVGPAATLVGPATRIGNINFPTDPDGFVRRLVLATGDVPALSVAAARAHDPSCCAVSREAGGGEVYVNYLGPPGTLRTVSYYQALAPTERLPAGTFAGKVVFVGLVTHAAADPQGRLPDHFPAPYSRWGHGYVPGVEIHATATANLLAGRLILPLSPVASVLLGLLVAMLLGAVFLAVSPAAGAVVLGGWLAGAAAVVLYLFVARDMHLSPIHLCLPAAAGYLLSPWFHYRQQHRQRRFIENAFSTYVAAPVVRQLIEEPGRLQLGGQSVEASILFLDVAGFTTLSERYEPQELVQIMNRFLDEITGIVLDHGGMIDKFIGDAVMAVWGVPLPDTDHARRACTAALAIARRIRELAAEEMQRTGAEISVRLGINSGVVVAGNIGGSRRFDYTVLGNDVNLASRLEGVNKLYGTQIMIGHNTAGAVGEDFELRAVDIVRVKGKNKPVVIHELQGGRGSLPAWQVECNRHFEEGVGHYRARAWAAAAACFRQALTRNPDDGPCHAYLERLHEFASEPPADDWDGVYDITTK